MRVLEWAKARRCTPNRKRGANSEGEGAARARSWSLFAFRRTRAGLHGKLWQRWSCQQREKKVNCEVGSEVREPACSGPRENSNETCAEEEEVQRVRGLDVECVAYDPWSFSETRDVDVAGGREEASTRSHRGQTQRHKEQCEASPRPWLCATCRVRRGRGVHGNAGEASTALVRRLRNEVHELAQREKRWGGRQDARRRTGSVTRMRGHERVEGRMDRAYVADACRLEWKPDGKVLQTVRERGRRKAK
ncbi:hypothetical protein ERJ75_000370000 [Trypanosoma vivax]|nr:hypothetical protein ERJ75_000370000 [Trypanosoma vivax]